MWKATITKQNDHNSSVKIWLLAGFVKENRTLKDVVLDFKNLRFREPTIDDNKTSTIITNSLNCKFLHVLSYDTDIDQILGQYDIVKEGDWYYLEKNS